jgi:mitogen-activated protein kinase kinase 4
MCVITKYRTNFAVVQRIRSTVDEREQKNLLKELEVIVSSRVCPCIVQFYGAIFKEVSCTEH